MKYHVLIGPGLLLFIWMIVSVLELVDPFFLPGPVATLGRLISLFVSGSILSDLASTIGRVTLSFGLAVLIGWPCALWLGSSEPRYRSVEFLIDFFRSTPSTALFPLFLLLFGVTDRSKVAAAASAAIVVVVFNTASGVLRVHPARVSAARMMGASPWQIFRSVLFWESLPQTFIGLRSAVSITLIIIIVTEMFIGTVSGLGRRIIDAQITYEITTMYAVILLAGILGYGLNLILLLIERRWLHWSK